MDRQTRTLTRAQAREDMILSGIRLSPVYGEEIAAELEDEAEVRKLTQVAA